MLKKAVQQGRSERRGEEVHTALRVGRSPLEWILANGKSPSVLPTSEKPLLNVEPLSDARTSPGEKRVSARRAGRVRKATFSASCFQGESSSDDVEESLGGLPEMSF
jgi:hypothetical protein